MIWAEFDDKLRQGLDAYGLELDHAPVTMLYSYFIELKRWSKKVNLIARETDDQTIVEKHFIDSLALLMVLHRNQDSLLDIGSGAGFPGLVCKMAVPRMRVSLIEPRLKRVSFLRHIIRMAGLEDITVQASRLERGSRVEQEATFNCIVSRAVTDIPKFLAMCEGFCVKGKRVICMRGPRFRQELKELPEMMDTWHLSDVREYNLPFSGASRTLLSFTCRNDEKKHDP